MKKVIEFSKSLFRDLTTYSDRIWENVVDTLKYKFTWACMWSESDAGDQLAIAVIDERLAKSMLPVSVSTNLLLGIDII